MEYHQLLISFTKWCTSPLGTFDALKNHKRVSFVFLPSRHERPAREFFSPGLMWCTWSFRSVSRPCSSCGFERLWDTSSLGILFLLVFTLCPLKAFWSKGGFPRTCTCLNEDRLNRSCLVCQRRLGRNDVEIRKRCCSFVADSLEENGFLFF